MQLGDRVEDALFLLLRAGLWNEAVVSNSVFPLNTMEWHHLFKLSHDHTIQGVIFDGMASLPATHQAPKDLYIRWMVTVEKIALQNRKMNKVIAQQYVLFQQQNISPILLKGQYLASFYPNPVRRVCGDVDWWFPNEEAFSIANTCMSGVGSAMVYPTATTANYAYHGMEMDHHQRMIDAYNPFVQKYIDKLIRKELAQENSISLDSVAVLVPSPLLGLVQVNMHILKHLLSFGIGLRQLCDAAILYKRLAGTFQPKELLSVYKKIGVSRWIQVLHDILFRKLGIDSSYLPGFTPNHIDSDWMLREILQGGNFGFHDERYREAETTGARMATRSRVAKHIWQYLPYAPFEALSFPIAHYIDRFGKK